MFTKNKLALVAFIGVVVLAIVAAAVIAFTPKPDLTSDLFPERFGNELQLPQNTGSIRTLEMWEDQRTPKFGIEDHADGSTTHYRYRPDGTLASATLYAAADQSGNREVIRDSTMAADGFTYLKDITYFQDGTVWKDFVLADDGTTHRKFYHPNGVLAKEQVMEYEWRVWKLMSEQAFFDDGKKSRVFLITRGKSLEDTIYGAGQVLQVHKKHDYVARTYNETWYHDDGKTPLRVVEQTADGTTATVMRRDGTIAEEYRWWGEVQKSGITVNVFDRAGRKRYQQTYWWGYHTNKLEFRSVEVFDANGTLTNFVMYYTSGPESGKVEAEVTFSSKEGWKGPHVRREYRKDGSLAVAKTNQNTSTTVFEQKFDAAQNIQPTINPQWIVRHMVDTPPQMVTYVPPRD
jgi:antitoxin component YwqK of YwqJK toxin-antitoxin module